MVISDTDPAVMTEAERKWERKLLLQRLKQLNAYPRSDWHREFEDALQLDVESWDNGSWVIREHSLGEDAPRIDFIVVSGNKLPDDVKAVFKGFRHNNAVEFKGPGDKLTRLTLYKSAAYGYFLIATAGKDEDVNDKNVTVIVFASEADADDFRALSDEGIIVATNTPGVYDVRGLTDIPFRLVMIGELDGDDYATYRILRKHADENDVKILLDALRNTDSQTPRDRLHRLLELAETKNPGSVAELIKEDKEMASIFMQVLKPEIDEHDRTNLYMYVQKGGMTIEFAAEQAGITPAQFMQEMESHGYHMPQMA